MFIWKYGLTTCVLVSERQR